VIAVHGPHTWGQPFFAQTEDLAINVLGPQELEVKFLGYSTGGDTDYVWDFGDNSPTVINGFEVRHTYTSPGPITIRVTVQTPKGPKTAEISLVVPDGEARDAEVQALPQRRPKVA
jgi:hypothetical protein